ncbi:MAG: hypothetical protein SFV23_15640 [Planctomycetaceae bacterium]|nr:hypothetical protein [Planctomycetaceae bacterium]
MIRIETTAEFDAEGHFTVSGQTTAAIAPGSHRVVLELIREDCSFREDVVHPALIVENGLLLLNLEPTVDANVTVSDLIDSDREERMNYLLGG